MNNETIIEQLLQTRDAQLLSTSLDDLKLSVRVYRSLRRAGVRTVREVAEIWTLHRDIRRIGEGGRREILGALQAWYLSLPHFPTSAAEEQLQTQAQDPGCGHERQLPIEALPLSPRTYHALKRHQIHTLDDIARQWETIVSIRHFGPGTLVELQAALDLSGVACLEEAGAEDDRSPDPESQPPKADLGDRSITAGEGTVREDLRPTYVITEGGVLVNAGLLQAEEPRRSRAERWEHVPPQAQAYAPKNAFQAIAQEPDRISSPSWRPKTPLDGAVPIATEWRETSLYLLEKARTSRQVRTINCPICMARTLSIRFKEHLITLHPQAFGVLKKSMRRR